MKEYRQTHQLPGTTVRMGRPEDAEPLHRWIEHPPTTHTIPCGEPNELEDCAKRWTELHQQQAVLTAEREGVPVGMIVLFVQNYIQLSHQCMHILIVDPNHRREGIGTLLLKEAMIWGKEGLGLTLLHVEVTEGTEGEPFYRHHGFEEFARQSGWIKEESGYYGRVLLEKMV